MSGGGEGGGGRRAHDVVMEGVVVKGGEAGVFGVRGRGPGWGRDVAGEVPCRGAGPRVGRGWLQWVAGRLGVHVHDGGKGRHVGGGQETAGVKRGKTLICQNWGNIFLKKVLNM